MIKKSITLTVIIVAISFGFYLYNSGYSEPEETAENSIIQINLAEVDHTQLLSSFKVDNSTLKNGQQGTISWIKPGSLLDKRGVKKGDVIISIGNANGVLEIRSF